MVTTPRTVQIHDGKITLPEDMLEQSGIGTADGTVIVDLRASGEIVVRANTSPGTDDDPVDRTAGIFRKYTQKLPTDHLSTQEQVDAWKDAFEQGIAEEVWQSMKGYDDGKQCLHRHEHLCQSSSRNSSRALPCVYSVAQASSVW